MHKKILTLSSLFLGLTFSLSLESYAENPSTNPPAISVDIYEGSQDKPLPKGVQDHWINEAQHFLNGIKTLSAQFVQVTTHQNGQTESRDGYLKWLRPAHIKFNYSGKPLLQVVSDGESFRQKDEDGSSMPIAIENTPAGLILSKIIDFRRDAVIKRVMEKDPFVMITLASKEDPEGATLTLIFKKSPFSLAQWTTVDTTGRIIDVILLDPRMNISMGKNEFKLD